MKAPAAALLVLCACVHQAPRAAPPPPPEVEVEEVAECKPLGRFSGSSAQPGDAGMQQARTEARAKAAAAGATHLVVGREWQTPDAASASVAGFDCTPMPGRR